MRPDKILALTSFAMLACAITVHFVAAPIPAAAPRYVPIEQFPARIGNWTQSAVLPIAEAVKLKLPTAHIVDRIYRDPQGDSIEVTLLSATRRDDMHDPARCLPSQGWIVTEQRAVHLGGQSATAMTVTLNGSSANAFYWFTGYYAPDDRPSSFQALLESVRGHIVKRQQGMSLFVRLMTSDSADSESELNDFALHIQPILDRIKSESLRPGERVRLSNGEYLSRA